MLVICGWIWIYLHFVFLGYIENITLEVRSPVDYPLDVYFLMDLSYSTTDDIETMKALANDIGWSIYSNAMI